MTTYQTIFTSYGLARLAAAAVSGVPINLTHMAVGDGNGSAVTPTAGMTALVHEVYRTSINVVEQDPANPNDFYAEMLIDTSHGGWTIREFGIFDDTNQMVAVGNFPATYKTLITDGAVNDLVIRAELVVSNTSLITLVIDPNVALATRAWTLSTITIGMLLPGGTTHQVLRKRTNADGDIEWVDPTNVNVIVDMVQEIQTASGTQATFNLTVVTTIGLAVYVAGVRLPFRAGAGGWQLGTPSSTQVVLGTIYPAGTEVAFVQNEPAGTLGTPLQASQNLADLTNTNSARLNLNVYSKQESTTLAPPGLVGHFAMVSAPTGWLKANGAVISRAVYANLFAAIGTLYGAGDGSTTFALPDLRGEFLRAFDDGRGLDTGRSFGSAQGYSTAPPQSGFPSRITQAGIGGLSNATNPSKIGFVRVSKAGESVTIGGVDSVNSGTEIDVLNMVTGDLETRPVNVALLACIKY